MSGPSEVEILEAVGSEGIGESMIELFTVENLIALVTLTSLEIVLGIDNIVFIAIIAGRLGAEKRNSARLIGLALAVVTRLLLLFTLSLLASMTDPVLSLPWVDHIDIVFSLDSVITAVGMTNNLPVMAAAVVLAVVAMLIFSGWIVEFIEMNPTIKMLALSFLLMIGVVLVADGLGHHLEKGYIYFAMAFSLGVEMLNLRAAKSRKGRAH